MSGADVVVLGGGTIGAWAACFLAEAGRSVTLLEAATLDSGASSRVSGMCGRRAAPRPPSAASHRSPCPALPATDALKGWSGTWEIHGTVREVYAIF